MQLCIEPLRHPSTRPRTLTKKTHDPAGFFSLCAGVPGAGDMYERQSAYALRRKSCGYYEDGKVLKVPCIYHHQVEIGEECQDLG